MSRLPRTSACRRTLTWGAAILAGLCLAAWAVAPVAAQTEGAAASFTELPPDFLPGGELPPAGPPQTPPSGPPKTTVGPLTFYTDAALFDTDFPGLPLEDFEESPVPPSGIFGCNEPIDGSSNDDCFNPGEIIPGIAVGTFEGGHSGCPGDCAMITLGDGVLGQADVVAGPNFFAETLLLTMTEDACAVGLFSHDTVTETLAVTVTTQSGVFPTTAATSPTGLFWGVATLGDPIVSIRFASPSGGGELVDNVRVGVSTCSVADVSATKVDLPGTPAMPGDAISYQVDISNAGPDPASGVQFDDTPDPNTTLSGGVTTTPLALDDGLYAGDPTTPTTVDGTLQPLLLANDFGIPGTPTLAALPVVGQPTTLGGSVDVDADGSFTYVPPPGATGGEIDTFTYDVQNGIPPGSPATDTATASILLGLGPVAQDDLLGVVQNTMTVLDAAADNGSGADDFGVPTGAVDLYGPVGGPLATAPGSALVLASGNTVNFDVSGNGTFTHDATVNPTFSGVEMFEYQITNTVGSDTAVVAIEVQAPPAAVDDAPDMLSAPGDAFHTALNTPLDTTAHATPSVLANDDLGFPLAAVVSYGTSASPTDQTVPGAPTATDNGGAVVVAADGNFVYTPPSPTFTGPDMFGYRIQNAVGFDDGVVTIAVGLRPACDDEVDPDDYDALGNVQITVPGASGVLIGDSGDEITVTGSTAPASGGSVVVAADGGFTYTSGSGFTGDDTFTYTVGNGFGDSAACTVEVTVANTIWFIDNQAAGGGNGTQSAPYDSFTAYATPALDDAGDIIFVDAGDGTSGDYDTGIVLKNNQRLIGQGVDLATAAGLTPPPFSDTLPGVATRPLIKNTSGAGVTLANGNLATGFDISGASGASIAATNSVGATIEEVGLVSSGGDGMAFTNVTGTIDINNLDVSVGSTLGVNITGGSATYDFDAGSSITSPTGTAFQISGGSASVTYHGSITQANNATTVSVSNHTTGTVTFQTGTISATNGNGLQFSNADGTYNFTATTTLNGGDAGIDILAGSSGGFTFDNATITSPTNGAFNIDASSATVSYTGGSITQTSAATAYRANGNTGGTQNIGVQITANTSTAAGISLTSNPGTTISFTGALDLDTTSGQGLVATGGGTVTTNAGVTNTVNTTTGRGVNIANTTIGGSGVTFASITVGAAPNGILLDSTGAGDFTVTGTTSATAVAGNAIQCKTVGGDVDVGTLAINGTSVTSTQTFFDADPGAGVRYLPNANGTGDGIFLDGVTGSFTANGGTIQDVGDNAADIFNSSNVTLSGVTISDGADGNVYSTTNTAVQATTSSNINLIDVSISNFGNEVAAGSTIRESALAYRDVSGTALIQRTTIDTGTGFVFERNAQLPENLGLELENRNVNLTLTVTGSTFRRIDFEGIQARYLDGDLTLTVDGGTADGANTFEFINGAAINFGQTAADGGGSQGTFYLGDSDLTDIGIGARVGLINTSDVTLHLVDNVVTRTFSDGFRIRGFGGATSSSLVGTITGNLLDDVGLAISTIPGQNPGAGNGFEILMENRTNSILLVDGNTIDDVVDNGGSIGVNVANNSLSDMDLVFTNNIVRGITSDGLGGDPATDFQLITTGSGVGAASTCLALTGNNFTPTMTNSGNGVEYDMAWDIGIDGQGSTLTLEDYATPAPDVCSPFGLPANPEQFIDANNTTDQDCAVIDQFGIGVTTVDPAPGGADLCTRPPA